MTPIVNGLEQEFAGQLEVIRFDAETEEGRLLQQQFGVRGHPAFVTLDENDEVSERFFGIVDESQLRTALMVLEQ